MFKDYRVQGLALGSGLGFGAWSIGSKAADLVLDAAFGAAQVPKP